MGQTEKDFYRALNALEKYFPRYNEIISGQILPTEQAKFDAAAAMSPQYQQLQNDLVKQFGPEAAMLAANIERISRNADASTTTNILSNYGPQLAEAARLTDAAYERPEDKALREAGTNQVTNLLNSINLNDSTEEARRYVNQEAIRAGGYNAPSATNTVSNALSFGKEMDNRRERLSQAIQTAANFMPTTQIGRMGNPGSTLLNNQGNTGTMTGITNPGTESAAMGTGLFSDISDSISNEVSNAAGRASGGGGTSYSGGGGGGSYSKSSSEGTKSYGSAGEQVGNALASIATFPFQLLYGLGSGIIK